MVKCPICGIERKFLFKHIKTHGIKSKEEFKVLYPNCKLYDESISEKLSEIQLEINKLEKVRENKSKASKKVWERDSYRSKMSVSRKESAKKQWENRESESVKRRVENIRKAQINLWKEDSYRKKQCKAFSEKWKDPDYRKQHLETFTNTKVYIREQDGKEVVARSSYEVTCTWYLDQLGLVYEYEKGPYEVFVPYENRVTFYYPDFYIKSLDLFIEVKSEFYYIKDKKLNDIKFSTIRQNHKLVLVMENELSSIENFVKAINNELEKQGCADTLINPPQNGRS